MFKQRNGFINLPVDSISNGEVVLQTKKQGIIIEKHSRLSLYDILKDNDCFAKFPLSHIHSPGESLDF